MGLMLPINQMPAMLSKGGTLQSVLETAAWQSHFQGTVWLDNKGDLEEY